jgi:hypothetical protein
VGNWNGTLINDIAANMRLKDKHYQLSIRINGQGSTGSLQISVKEAEGFDEWVRTEQIYLPSVQTPIVPYEVQESLRKLTEIAEQQKEFVKSQGGIFVPQDGKTSIVTGTAGENTLRVKPANDWAFDRIEKRPSRLLTSVKSCVCDIVELQRYGCRCGAYEEEQRAHREGKAG